MKTRKGKYHLDPEDEYSSDSSRDSSKSEQLGSIAKEDELKRDEQGSTAVNLQLENVEDEDKDEEDHDHDHDDDDSEPEEHSQELLPFLTPPKCGDKNNEANPSHDVVHRRLLATGMTHRNVLNPKTNKFHLVPMTQDGPTPPSVDENDQDSKFDDPLPHSNDWSSSSEEEEEEKEVKKKKARAKNAIIELGDSSQEGRVDGGVITQKDLDEDEESEESDDDDKKPAATPVARKEVIELGDSSQESADLNIKCYDDSDAADEGDRKPAARNTTTKGKKKKVGCVKVPAPESFVPVKEIPLLKYLKVSSKANKTVVERKQYIRHFAHFGIQRYIKPEAMADATLGPDILALEEKLSGTMRNYEAHWKQNNIGEWMWSIHRYMEIADARYGKKKIRHLPKTVRAFKNHIVRMQEYTREKTMLEEAAGTGQKRGKYKVGGQPKYAKDVGDLVQHMIARRYNGKQGKVKWTSLIIKNKKCPECNDMCLVYDKSQKELKMEFETKQAKYKKAKKDWEEKIKDFQPKKGEKEPKPPNFPVRHVVCMCMLLHCEHVLTGKGCPKCMDFISRGIKIPQTANGDCDCKVCSCNCISVFPDNQWAQKIREVTEKRLRSVDEDNKKAFKQLAKKQTDLRESFTHMGMLANMVNDPDDGIGVPSPGPYPDTFTMDYYQRNNPGTAFTPSPPVRKKHAREQHVVTGSASDTNRNVRRRLDDDVKDELALKSHRILNQPSYSSAETMEKRAALQLHFPKSTEVRDGDGSATSINDLQQQHKDATRARRSAYEMHRRNHALNRARASPPSAAKRSPYSYDHLDQKIRNNGLDTDYRFFHGDEHLRRPDNVAEGNSFEEHIPKYPYALKPKKQSYGCDPVQDFPKLQKMREECLAVVKNPNRSNIDKGKSKKVYSLLNGFVNSDDDFEKYQTISIVMEDSFKMGYTENETMAVLLDML